MALKDLDTFFDPDLHLPIRGKKYAVPSPEWETVKRLQARIFDDEVPPLIRLRTRSTFSAQRLRRWSTTKFRGQ
ncbi:hypothetical protein GS415_02045 [Rhodococcus hoagii]|nr:hypothetical protein [Prescottella equi]